MRAPLGDRLRLTVLGCSTAAPHPASPTAGFLVEWGTTALLLDVGQGVIRNLQRVLDPLDLSAAIVGHMHADHYLDLVGLRYLFPWGEPAETPLPVYLPPGGRQRLDALAMAISERVGFFDAAYDAIEYEPGSTVRVGELTVRFVRGRHYVPAWGVVVEAPDGTRLAYSGDTGPSDAVAAGLGRAGADVHSSAAEPARYATATARYAAPDPRWAITAPAPSDPRNHPKRMPTPRMAKPLTSAPAPTTSCV